MTQASFPSSIKTFTQWRNIGDPSLPQGDIIFGQNDIEQGNEITAIEATLGTNPQGGAATVSARIAALEGNVSTPGHTHPHAVVAGGLTGDASGDDHPQYPLVNGSRGFSQPVGGVAPTIIGHLGTKGYIDAADAAVAANVLTNASALATNYTNSQVATRVKSLGTGGLSSAMFGSYNGQQLNIMGGVNSGNTLDGGTGFNVLPIIWGAVSGVLSVTCTLNASFGGTVVTLMIQNVTAGGFYATPFFGSGGANTRGVTIGVSWMALVW